MVRINSQQALQNIQLKSEVAKAQDKPQMVAIDKNDSFFGIPAFKGDKITSKEGLKLFLKGAKTRIFNMGKEIKEHPVRTVLVSAGTVAALSALPLIGITVATGAAVIAGVFGTITGVHVLNDLSKILKFNKQGEYNKVRNQIKNLGGDTFDLAMVLPFMPKGLKQFKQQLMPSGFRAFLQELKSGEMGQQFKFQFEARKAFRLNRDLFEDICKTSNYFKKIEILLKSNNRTVEKMDLKPGFFTNVTRFITEKLPGFEGKSSLFHNLTSSSFGTFMGVTSTSSMIAKRAKEIGLDDENVKIIEEHTKDAAKIITMSPFEKFTNVFNLFSNKENG